MGTTKVALILYTSGLQYDDRIRKEILSLCKFDKNLEFEIFAVVPQNVEEHGITDYGVKYHILHLKSRDKYASASHGLAKAFDFYKTLRKQLRNFDVIWCADIETFMFPLLLSPKKPIIWDLHELPARFMSNPIMKMVFKYLERKCRLFYHANQSRIDYLLANNVIKDKSKHIAIRNYPEIDIASKEVEPDEMFNSFCAWLGDSKCAYVQGISGEIRRGVETISAVMSVHDLRAVVVGRCSDKTMNTLRAKYGSQLESRIYFVGKVPQKLTKLYMSKCCISLVFYQMCSANNILCEPNRLFQSLMMGLPVVVGCNKPMSELVEKYSWGIALDNDGENVESITKAINDIQSQYEDYKSRLVGVENIISWETQESLLFDTFSKVIK